MLKIKNRKKRRKQRIKSDKIQIETKNTNKNESK